MGAIEISPAVEADLPQVIAWSRELRAGHATRMPVYFPPEGQAAHEAEMTRALSEARVVVARRGGDPLGFACWSKPEGPEGAISASVQGYFVRPDLRGQGIGRALLAAIAAEKEPHGWQRVTAAVWAGNPASMACLAGAGFAPEFALWRLGDLPPRTSPPRPGLRQHWLVKGLVGVLAVFGATALVLILLHNIQS